MSKNSRQAHEVLAPEEVTAIDQFEPDYDGKCIACGESPTVIGIRSGKVVYAPGMCGRCTFGEASASDPSNW